MRPALQNRLYVACTDGDLSFCDAGATAVGPAGEDLTAAVLALPAELSVAEACAEPGACDTYRFASHGLRVAYPFRMPTWMSRVLL